MREITVRGYAVDEMVDSQWMYGTGVHRTVFTEEFAKECGQSGETFIWTDSGWILVHEESVGQATGLKDENGNEIFEGDIIKSFNQVGYVKFELGGYYIEWIKEKYDSYVTDIRNNGEVIGNIYENPELLEVDK